MNREFSHGPADGNRGFTLLEVLIAVFITAMVLAAVSQAFSFSTSLWMRESKADHVDETAYLVRLMSDQIGCLYPFDPGVTGGRLQQVQGDETRLALVTSCSVKAANGGAPVLAVYAYDPSAETVSYSEMPVDWDEVDAMVDFAQDPSEGPRHGYSAKYGASSFALSYLSPEGEELDEDELESTVSVVVDWTDRGGEQERNREIRLGYLALLH